VASYSYEPFGNTTQTGTSANSYQYTGRENDGAGLYFNRSRYYSPAVQRFVSQDPIGFAGGVNLYSYVSNNPIKFTDPFGHDKNDPWLRTFGKTLVHNFFSMSFYAEEYGDGGCLNTFLNGTVAALNPVGASFANDFGIATLAVSPIYRYNAAQAYAAAQTNVLGGEGLIFTQKSIPYNRILKGNAVQTLGEFGWGYLDGALLQGVIDEWYAARKGTCH
jgi:RHS repeat-associated protein